MTKHIYTYFPDAHDVLLQSKTKEAVADLIVPLAELIERECANVLSGVDRMGIANFRRDGQSCIDGDAYFRRFHAGENEVDILLGVKEKSREMILVADCKIQMKGGASIANPDNLPDICENIYDKYCSAMKNINPILPITPMYVIFNHAVASVARRYLSRCSLGSNVKCKFVSCFKFQCVTIEGFRKLVSDSVA